MGSHRRVAPSGLPRGRTAALGVLSVAAAALGAVPGTSAQAAPLDETRAEVDRLHTAAERATEAYHAAGERAGTLRRQIRAAQDHVARRQQQVNTLRESLGSLAGAQYRDGGVDPVVVLLLTSEPDDYLDKAAVFERIGARRAGELRALRKVLRELAQERAEATRKAAELAATRGALAAHKKTVVRKLAAARRLLNSLPDADRAAYDRVSRTGRTALPLPGGGAAASGRAAAALAAAQAALGRPYVWGANGPSAFDCSGLMQWAYARAGVALPRTSQAQRNAGRRVPLSEARPGDLVVYRSDASHIGMYAGNGQVIHAPYPGAPVRYDPVGMMPVSAVTRV
ncbi:NlpC/P60 family protein [Streptomyces sp. NPDC005925]|uniref:C40 family peptidase n=1 Tax=Streptomyces sp. NPDC005925 TaxID=3157172 RepID=UPI0033FF4933